MIIGARIRLIWGGKATRLRRRYTRIDDEHRAIRVSHHKFGDTFHARFRGAMCGSP